MSSLHDNPSIDDNYDDEEDIDFSDLRAQYEVRLEEGLDTFVVLDGLPKVPEDSKAKLIKFISRKLTSAGNIREDGFHMPVDQTGATEGYENSTAVIFCY
jgi:translation initiation factor 3 subunit B